MELALQITLVVTSVLVVLLVLLHRAKGGGLSTLFVTGIWLVSIIGVALLIKYS